CDFKSCKDSLNPGGRLLLAVGTFGQTLSYSLRPRREGKQVLCGTAPERSQDLALLMELAQSGAFKPVIDSTYPLGRIVEAHRRVDTGRKRGAVIVTIG